MPEPLPLTWQLLQAVERCLQSITVANGYSTDAGDHVTLEPAQLQGDEQVAVAVALDRKGRAQDPALRSVGELIAFNVAIKVDAALEQAQITLHRALSDVERAMADRQAEYPTGVQFPRYIEASVIPPAEGMSWIGALVRFESHVRTR